MAVSVGEDGSHSDSVEEEVFWGLVFWEMVWCESAYGCDGDNIGQGVEEFGVLCEGTLEGEVFDVDEHVLGGPSFRELDIGSSCTVEGGQVFIHFGGGV